jgi:hypothetical protein
MLALIPGRQYFLRYASIPFKIILSVKEKGISKTLGQLKKYIVWRLNLYRENYFDNKYGVETSENENLYLESIQSSSKKYAVPYEPIQFEVFNEMMKQLDIDKESYVFIDLGSGKARSLMYAAEFRFKKMIGVEFSSKLHDVAMRNVRAYMEKANKHQSIELICGDAVDFEFPDDNIALFLYNPFYGEVMNSVIKNIITFIRNNKHDLVILYRNPVCDELFKEVDGLMLCKSNSSYNIYRKIN